MQFDLDLGAIESEEGPKCLYEAAISNYYARYIYVGSPSRKPAFLETNCFRENRLLVYTVRTGSGPTKARCRGTLDASVSVVGLLSEQRR